MTRSIPKRAIGCRSAENEMQASVSAIEKIGLWLRKVVAKREKKNTLKQKRVFFREITMRYRMRFIQRGYIIFQFIATIHGIFSIRTVLSKSTEQ